MNKKKCCCECGKKTQCVHPILDVSVCRQCQGRNPEKYGFICKSTALKSLSAERLKELPYFEVDNPHYKCAATMKLYLKAHVSAATGMKQS